MWEDILNCFNTSTFTFVHVYITLIPLPWKQWKIGSIEYKIYDVLFDRTFVRKFVHASKYSASCAVNISSNAHTFSCRNPLFSTKFNRNVNKSNKFFWNFLIFSYIKVFRISRAFVCAKQNNRANLTDLPQKCDCPQELQVCKEVVST